MLDRIARRWLDPRLDPLAACLTCSGISANSLTCAGFLLGTVGCAAIVVGWHKAALVLILANRLCDGLDGMVARRTHATDVGGFLDSVADAVFYAAVPFCFGLSRPDNLLASCGLLFSFFGTSGSFLAFAILAAKRGIPQARNQQKSFFYSVGLMEGTETILFFVLFCLFPESYGRLAWTFTGLCWLTTVHRVINGIRTFSEDCRPEKTS
jgi:phosphatidylglycerophosphate synthase